MNFIIILFAIAEILVFCLGFFVWFRRNKNSYPVSKSLALSISSGLALISFLFQIGFLVGLPEIIPIFEGFTLICILWLNRENWGAIDDIRKTLAKAGKKYPKELIVLVIILLYLLLQSILLPPSSWDSLTYHLPRVLLWEQNSSLFLEDFTISPQASFPVGSDILFHLFLRFHSDYGLGLFSWMSYITILCGTYALVRPRVSRSIAFTTALIIACLPEIVYQSTATKNDIILAAIVLTCIIWSDCWLKDRSFISLLGLALTLCFGISIKISFILFAFFFLTLWLSLIIWQGHFFNLINLIRKKWDIVLVCMIPGLILSQVWLFIHNYHIFGNWSGTAEFAFNNQNNEGLLGGIANLVRYSFQNIHFLQPVDKICDFLMRSYISSVFQSIYDNIFAPLFGNMGQAEYFKNHLFEIKWQPQEDTSWFGPFSLFVIFPSVIWCIFKERQLTRILSIVTVSLILAISFKIGWSPWKSRFFTMVFVCTGLCVATFLQQMQVKKSTLSVLRWLSILILIYACLYNYNKPFIPSNYYLSSENIWTRSDWTSDRLIYSRLYHGSRIDRINQILYSAKRVAIVGYDHYFSVMFHNPHVNFTLLASEYISDKVQSLEEVEEKLINVDHLICFSHSCTLQSDKVALNLLWENDSQDSFAQIYRVSSDI